MASMSRPRTSSITELSPAAGREPGWAKTRMPSRNAINVGIDVMLASWARYCSASVSTLPNTMSGLAVAAASNTGAKLRHGPHHEAQKSTRTMSPSAIVVSNVVSVSSMGLMEFATERIWRPFPLDARVTGRLSSMSSVNDEIAAYWDEYAAAYDVEPDHGLG